MRKKQFRITTMIILSGIIMSLLASCGDNTAKKAFDQAKMSMASGDYRSAANYLRLAKNEGSNEASISELISITEGYLNSKDAYDKDDIDTASKMLSSIPSAYTSYSIARDIDSLRTLISDKEKTKKDIEDKLANVRMLLSYGDYTNAKVRIDELNGLSLTEEQRKQVNELSNTMTSAQKKIDDESKKKPDVVYVEKETQSRSSGTSSGSSARANFQRRLNELDSRSIPDGDQQTMNRAAGNLYNDYDMLLNDIYQHLKNTLPASEYASLQKSEVQWIKEKEAAMDAAENEHKGGSIVPLVRSGTGIEYTKKRCVYLLSLVQ